MWQGVNVSYGHSLYLACIGGCCLGDLNYNLHNLCILLLNTPHASTMESSQNTLRSYAQALLKLMGKRPGADDPKEDQPFGWARHLETQKTTYAQSAHKLLHALIEYSPSSEKVSQDFLDQLVKCENDAVVNLGDAVSTLRDPFYVMLNIMRKSPIWTAIVPSVR